MPCGRSTTWPASDDDRPFVLVASFTHPHDPYVTRRRYWDRYEGVEIPMPTVTAADVQPDDPHSARSASGGRCARRGRHR